MVPLVFYFKTITVAQYHTPKDITTDVGTAPKANIQPWDASESIPIYNKTLVIHTQITIGISPLIDDDYPLLRNNIVGKTCYDELKNEWTKHGYPKMSELFYYSIDNASVYTG